jgi:3D-(3,5/4)-trihydroxycyclohexane-1,2-dione acylhydrolase (decyclizing)
MRLTVAQALVRFLASQYCERDGAEQRLIAGCFGIFGHGNVAGVGQALREQSEAMPYCRWSPTRGSGSTRWRRRSWA